MEHLLKVLGLARRSRTMKIPGFDFCGLGMICGTVIACAILLAIISYFAQAAFDPSSSLLDANDTLTLLTVLLAVATTLLLAAIAQAFELIQWSRIANRQESSLLEVLAVSPSSSLLGVVRILFHGQTPTKAKILAFSRYVLITDHCAKH